MTPPERPAPGEPPGQPVVVDEQALRRAEAYVEEEEGAANRLTGALGAAVSALAVAMSLFHLYAAYSIVPTHALRAIHVAFVLALSFLVFPISPALPPPRHVVGLAGRGGGGGRGRVHAPRRRRLHRPQHLAGDVGHRPGRDADRADPRGDAPHLGLGDARGLAGLPRLRARRPVAPRPLDPQGLRRRPAGRPHVHDARGHLRRRHRRLLLAHHPVHDLRRLPPVLRRRQVLPRLLLRRDGRASPAGPGAPSSSPRSSWAGRRAAAWRPR